MVEGPTWSIPGEPPAPQLQAVPDLPDSWAPPPEEPPEYSTPREFGGTPERTRSWRFLSLSDLKNLPRPKPLIANTFDQDSLNMLAGDWGTYKSFVALDWAASIATGTPWNNRTTLQQSVLYIAGEGIWGISQRLEAWQRDRGVKIPDEQFTLMPDFFQILDNGDINELVSYIKGHGYQFIVIDTLARTLGGNEENSNTVMTQVITAGDQIRHASNGGAVLIVHHTGKDGKTARGGGSLSGGMDSVYMTSGGEGEVLLKRTKRKDGPLEDEHRLEFLEVEGTKSGVLIPGDPFMRQKTAKKSDEVYGIFKEHFGAIGGSRSEVVKVCVELGVKQATAYDAINQLVDEHRLIQSGSESRPRYALPQAR